jgi:hypothetical protein
VSADEGGGRVKAIIPVIRNDTDSFLDLAIK